MFFFFTKNPNFKKIFYFLKKNANILYKISNLLYSISDI